MRPRHLQFLLGWLGPALVCAFIALALLWPVGLLMGKSLGADTLALMKTALGRESFRLSLLNSLFLAMLCGLLALVFGGVGALLATHTRVPRGLLDWLTFLPLVLPPFVGAVGVKRLLVDYGPVNLFLMDHGVITEPVPWVTHFGLWGVALLQALHLFPLVYFQLAATLARQDPALTEAARVHGLPPPRAWRRVSLPLLAPALVSSFLMVAVFSLTDLGTPLLFDFPNVLAARIYSMAREGTTDPLGYLYALWLLGVVLLASGLLRRAAASRPVALEADRPHERRGGLWLGAAAVWFTGLTLLSLAPHATVLLTALAQEWVASLWPEKLAWDAFASVWQAPLTQKALRWGLLLSAASAVLMALGAMTAALTTLGRQDTPWARRFAHLLDLPLLIPGILVAYGWLAAYTGTPLDAFTAPVVALLCAYTVRRLPLVFRSVDSAARALSNAPFEAARVHGLGGTTTFWRVTLPLLWPALFSGAMTGFAFTFFEVSDSLLLATNDQVVPMAKAMYQLANTPGDGPRHASALGVVGMGVMATLYALTARLGGGLGAVFGGQTK